MVKISVEKSTGTLGKSECLERVTLFGPESRVKLGEE